MKWFVVLLFPLLAGFGAAWADELVPEHDRSISGTVLETQDVEHYTYLRLQTSDGEIWAAIPTTAVKSGAQVTIVNFLVMDGFESPSLHRTFDRIVFGQLAESDAAAMPQDMAAMHSVSGKPSGVAEVSVEKATGADACTVAEVVDNTPALKEHVVTIRGQVVKFTPNVMGKNWLHLRDGSGSAADGSNDIMVVTQDDATVGDVVVVKGVVRADRDLGSGYSYKVLIEEAKLQR